MADRASHRFLEPVLLGVVATLEYGLVDPDCQAGIVADEPGADLVAAAAEAVAHPRT